jgi:hypothetical protein
MSAFLCVVLFCVGRGLATGRSPSKESYQNVQKYIHSFRSQILNRIRPEDLIRIIILIFYKAQWWALVNR